MKKDISTIIRDKRIKKGYKQQYMAHQMQMTQANYSKIETGKILPSIIYQSNRKIGEYFGYHKSRNNG